MAPADGAVAEPVATPTTPATPDSRTSPDAGGKPAASQPEPKWEDDPRVKGMLADLKKEREARQAHERRLSEFESTVKERDRRIAALAGVTPIDPKEADAELVRSKILELMPELADVGSIAEMKAALEEQQVQGFANHSKQMVGRIHQRIATEFGGDLNARQRQFINAAYLYENQTNPAFHARHNQGDPALIEEFAKDMIDNFVEPIRRKAASSEASRFRPVPGGRDRSTPVRGEKPKTSEEMLAAHYLEKTRRG